MRYSYANVVQGVESSNTVRTVVDDDDISPDKGLDGGSKQNTTNLNVLVYNSDVVDNSFHPLFIHNSDHLGLIFNR